MTQVRQLAQSDPVPNLSAQWTDSIVTVRKRIADLTRDLREMDDLADKLADHEINVSAELGPIGNAAAAARRDLERQKPNTFAMPHHG